jgi:hypothetical protein
MNGVGAVIGRRRVLVTVLLAAVLFVSSLFLPAVRFLGEGPGWASLVLSGSFLLEPLDLFRRSLFFSPLQKLYSAFLWLPFVFSVSIFVRLGIRRSAPVPAWLFVSQVISVFYTLAAPVVFSPGFFLVGFYVWLASLAALAVAAKATRRQPQV